MVSVRKNAKLLTRILAILVIAIWGEIAYQLILTKKQSLPVVSRPAASDLIKTSHDRTPYLFKDNVRDPFAYIHPAVHVRKKPKAVPLILRLWCPPPVSLEGVVIGSGKRTAIIADESGQTYFLAQGDTLNGLRILEVNDKQVEYSYHKKDSSWTVQR